jgi:hypothetical protein
MNQNDSDAVIDEIRAARHRISERCGHDPEKLVAYYIELQKRHGDRLIESGRAAQRKYRVESR